mmetsp:Transcript_91569/g.236383  ORF Transcript_91569/g.236383 Transcript_91569/m.236383 type:complete len:206 (-) Transcript_91569:3-620(-)
MVKLRACCAALAQAWGLIFWVAIFVHSAADLAPRSLDPLRHRDLTVAQWVGYVLITVGLVVFEGIGAFQRSFSPLLVRRARELQFDTRCHELVLAPFFVAGLFAASPRRLIKSWLLIFLLVPGLALTVPHLPYPWREAIDAGVVLGLSWGTVAIVAFWGRAVVTGAWPEINPDFPTGRQISCVHRDGELSLARSEGGEQAVARVL